MLVSEAGQPRGLPLHFAGSYQSYQNISLLLVSVVTYYRQAMIQLFQVARQVVRHEIFNEPC